MDYTSRWNDDVSCFESCGIYYTPWPNLLKQRGYNIYNRAKGGDTYELELLRFEEDVLALNPDIVLLGGGGNDCWKIEDGGGISDTAYPALIAMIQECWERGIYVILVGYSPRDIDMFTNLEYFGFRASKFDARNNARILVKNTTEMTALQKEIASTCKIPFIDAGGVMNSDLVRDYIHENQNGYNLIADMVDETLQKVLQQSANEQKQAEREKKKISVKRERL